MITGLIRDRFTQRITGLDGVSDREKMPFLAWDFSRFSAAHPELVRFTSTGNRSSTDTHIITGRNIEDPRQVEVFEEPMIRLLKPGKGAY